MCLTPLAGPIPVCCQKVTLITFSLGTVVSFMTFSPLCGSGFLMTVKILP